MKIVSVVGARPQFIKCSVLSRELRENHREIIVHTGQHYDYELSKIFFDELGIPEPDYHLDVGSGTNGYQIGEMLNKTEKVLMNEQPDLVLVYGDTNSTLAGALAAAKLQIQLGHVEAGLRSFDRAMPEEINRILTDHCSNLLFCPTQTAINNLKEEHILSGIYLTGDVMADALIDNRELIERSGILAQLDLKSKEYLVVTIHRRENSDNRGNLEAIIDALCQVNETIVFPIHPRTQKHLNEYGLYHKLLGKVNTMKPLGYLEFLKLLSHARKVLTDSGGIQKEAYMLGVPCITLRENTEWVETVRDGWNILVGARTLEIKAAVREFDPGTKQNNIFESGACQEISDIINDNL